MKFKHHALDIVFDTDRVLTVVTWGDLLHMQATIESDPNPTPYTVTTALFALAGEQQRSGLRNLVQKTVVDHRAGQERLAGEELSDSAN